MDGSRIMQIVEEIAVKQNSIHLNKQEKELVKAEGHLSFWLSNLLFKDLGVFTDDQSIFPYDVFAINADINEFFTLNFNKPKNELSLALPKPTSRWWLHIRWVEFKLINGRIFLSANTEGVPLVLSFKCNEVEFQDITRCHFITHPDQTQRAQSISFPFYTSTH
jgi:hypothetical protein